MKRMRRSIFIAVPLLAALVATIFGVNVLAHAHGSSCPVRDVTTKTCFTAIQPAVSAANPGDTIRVSPGTYAGGIVINKARLKLQGTSDDKQRVIIAGTQATGPKFGITIEGADNVQISGFEIYGFSGKMDASGIFVGGLAPGDTANRANSATISHNIIHDNGNGIYLWESNGNKVTGNTVYHNLDFTGSEGTGITSFNGFGDAQVSAANASGYSGTNNSISHNNVYNNDRLGIFAGACTEPAYCAGPTGVHDNITGTHIEYNTVYGNGAQANSYSEGIGLLDSSGGFILNNTITKENYFGILINHADTVLVSGNQANSNDLRGGPDPFNGGIRVSGSQSIAVLSNTTNYNESGVNVTSSNMSQFKDDKAQQNSHVDLTWDGTGTMNFLHNFCGTATPSKAVWHCK